MLKQNSRNLSHNLNINYTTSRKKAFANLQKFKRKITEKIILCHYSSAFKLFGLKYSASCFALLTRVAYQPQLRVGRFATRAPACRMKQRFQSFDAPDAM